MTIDLFTMRWLAGCLGTFFPDFEFTWLFPEFEQNLRQELDFRQEGYNSSRIKRMLSSNPKVYVPPVDWELTSSRVLTMQFIDGIKITNLEALEASGIQRREVKNLVTSTFAEMIYIHGFVHCDPHPGNLLVRKVNIGGCETVQLVLLDHGMYRRLDPNFRLSYCRLWKAILLEDSVAGERACRDLGMGDVFHIFRRLLPASEPVGSPPLDESNAAANGPGRRPRPSGDRFNREDHHEQSSVSMEVVASRRAISMQDINGFLQGLPRDILWVLRSQNITRSINLELGGKTVERVRINGVAAIKGLHLSNDGIAPVVALWHPFEETTSGATSTSKVTGLGNLTLAALTCSAAVATDQHSFNMYTLPGCDELNVPVASECSPREYDFVRRTSPPLAGECEEDMAWRSTTLTSVEHKQVTRTYKQILRKGYTNSVAGFLAGVMRERMYHLLNKLVVSWEVTRLELRLFFADMMLVWFKFWNRSDFLTLTAPKTS